MCLYKRIKAPDKSVHWFLAVYITMLEKMKINNVTEQIRYRLERCEENKHKTLLLLWYINSLVRSQGTNRIIKKRNIVETPPECHIVIKTKIIYSLCLQSFYKLSFFILSAKAQNDTLGGRYRNWISVF